jgi:hypothetical protein
MRRPRITPVSALARGLIAGVAGTAALTGLQALEARAKRNDGDGETQAPRDWGEAPAPAQVGQRVAAGVFERPVPIEHAGALTQVVHWLYGAAWGGVYGLLHESRRTSGVVDGVALGGAVVVADYTVLPAMRVYEPVWRYPASTLAKDLGRHLVYGLSVALAYRLLPRR